MSEYRETGSKRIDESDKIDLMEFMQDVYQGIKKFWWLVIGLAAIFAVQSYFSVSSSYQPEYVASATMAVRSAGTSSMSYINTQSAQQMAEVFPYILTSGVLQDVVAEDMGMESVPGNISASADEGTNLFTLSVSANDPQLAYNILQSVIENYPKVAEFVIGETTLDILDETGIPSDTGRTVVIRGSYRRGALKGAVIGLVIMALYIVTRRTVKSRKKLKTGVNLEDYGSIPFIREKKRKKETFYSSISLMNDRVPQVYLEAIRKLRVKVMKEMEQRGYRTLLITSSVPGEGKTTLAVNLAIAIAKQGKKVILVDCDPRNPSVADTMNDQEEHPGLGAVLRGKAELAEAMTAVEVSGGRLEILYGGEPNDKDSALLGTRRMRELLKVLAEHADIVILDTAPSGLLADAPALAKFVDGALYVVKYDYAKLRQIREGIQSLDMSGIGILGYVFNADKSSKSRAYGYGYSYGYKRYGSYGNYGHYGHYAASGRSGDKSGRVMKD
ncbi:MAG: polysaccharide biosynthesis tyrosine autokinase [Eubacteriales bacterium]|nr:polysaccharide biosynthesis tyrosine autokinase [Eubacteriales bacterium]